MTNQDRDSKAATIILGWEKCESGFINRKGKKVSSPPKFSTSIVDATNLLKLISDELKISGELKFQRNDKKYQCIFTSEKFIEKIDGDTVPQSITELCLKIAQQFKNNKEV